MTAVVDANPLIAVIRTAMTGLVYGEGAKPDVPAGSPYVVAWFDTGTVFDSSLLSRDGFQLTAVFQCYGTTPESVRVAVRKLRTAVLSLRGVSAGGRTFLMPEHLSAPPLQRDDDVFPPLFCQPDEWRFPTSA